MTHESCSTYTTGVLTNGHTSHATDSRSGSCWGRGTLIRGARDSPAFPAIDQIGYNPARFLDSLIERTECATDLTVAALIRGIQEIATIRAWIAVEVELRRADGGLRREIIQQLNRQQAELREETTTDTTAAEAAGGAESSEPSESVETAGNVGGDEPINDPRCPTCGEELTEERIAGQFGYGCCECRDFREPKATPSMDATQEDPILADGGEAESPRCPDCRAELTLEEIRDETAHWCSYCGGFRKPIGGTA